MSIQPREGPPEQGKAGVTARKQEGEQAAPGLLSVPGEARAAEGLAGDRRHAIAKGECSPGGGNDFQVIPQEQDEKGDD